MVPDISDPRVFYVTMEDPNGNELYEQINPIAQGLRIAPASKEDTECAGYISWFDLVGGYQRTIETKDTPEIDEQSRLYRIKNSDDGCTYVFRFLDKFIYDNYLHKLMLGGPDKVRDDEEIQSWFLQQDIYG